MDCACWQPTLCSTACLQDEIDVVYENPIFIGDNQCDANIIYWKIIWPIRSRNVLKNLSGTFVFRYLVVCFSPSSRNFQPAHRWGLNAKEIKDMWRSTRTHEELSFPANKSFFCSNNKKTKIENHFENVWKVNWKFWTKKLFWILTAKKLIKILAYFKKCIVQIFWTWKK